MNKRLLTLAASFLCTLFTFAQFSGSGSGTASDPYLIYNETQLSQMANFLNQSGVVFSLKKDLDLTSWIAENSPSQGWQPIGVSSSPFKGKLIGNGKTISGLSINRSGSSYVGFFGYLSGATISNLTIKGSSVKGGQYTGVLAGYASSSTLTNVNVEVTTLASGSNYSGGLIGYALNTTVNTFSVKATFNNSNNYKGGLSGYAEGCTFKTGTVEGKITVGSYGGGIVGAAKGTCSFSSCQYNGDISGSSNLGGIVGETVSGGSVTLTTCWSKGKIIGTGNYIGGVVGESNGASIAGIEGCSHFGDISGGDYVGGVVGAIVGSIEDEPTLHTYTVSVFRGNYGVGIEFVRQDKDKIVNGSPKTSSINNSTVIGNIEGNKFVGGLIGSDIPSYGFTSTYVEKYCGSELDVKGNIIYYLCYMDTNGSGQSSWRTGTYIGKGNDKYKVYTYTRNLTKYAITNNYYSGNIIGTEKVGGLAGEKRGGDISNNYSLCSIYGTTYVGGIIGNVVKAHESFTTTINSNVANCSTISATSSSAKIGRIYGAVDNSTTIGTTGSAEGNSALALCKLIKSGVTQTVSDNAQNGASVGPSLLRLKATYVAKGWSFDSYWNILETESYPYKKYQAAPPVIESELVSGATSISGNSVDGGTVYLLYKDNAPISTNCSGNSWSFSTEALQSGAQVRAYAEVDGKVPSYYTTATVGFPGSGTEADPYRIYSAEDLQGANKTGYYKLMNDIDLTSWINANSPTKGWVPIGLNSNDATYIDGDNHKVTGLWTNTADDYTGLFSNYSAGEIKNLTVEVATGKKVKGGKYTGILIGRMANGIITNCTVKGDVEGSQYTGGIVGYANSTPMSMLEAEGKVTGTSYVGGLAGYVGGTSAIDHCTATSTIIATGNAGGLVGEANGSGTAISNSHATATITVNGSGRVGGLAGNAAAPISKSIADATITVSGSNSYVGGLVGYTTGKVELSFANGSVSATGTGSNTGGLIGYVSGTTVTNCYCTANVSGTQYSAGLVAYALNTVVDKCYAKGNISGVDYGGGLVAQLDGSNASLSNSVAANNILSLSAQSSWGSRVIGGYKNGAPEPGENNYALSTMQVSLNGVPQTKTDDPVEGIAKPQADLMSAATYQGLGWNFSSVWGIDGGVSYPFLQWENEITPIIEITLDKTTLSIEKGKEATITANITPQNATNKQLNWTSSDEAVATVENGVVSAVAVGTATITAAATDGSGVTATCQVTVTISKEAAIAALQELVAEAQTLYDNSTEGENIGDYAPGSRAALLAVINNVNAQISSTMSDEAISQCTEDITAAIAEFQNQQVTAGEDTDYSTIANTIYLERVEAAAGSQVTLSVKMKNTVEVQGYQFDLYLPDGVTVATDEDGFSLIELSTARTTARKTDYFNSTVQPDGSIRVLCGSSKGYTFEGTDGEVATITLNIDENMEEGDHPIILKEVNLTDKNSTLYTTGYLKSTLTIINFMLGDVNGNKKVEVSDFIATANYILGNPPQVFIFKAGDVNSNNKIEVADFIGIANIILNGSGSSNAPAAAPKKALAASPKKAATDIDALSDAIYMEPVTAAPGTQQVLSVRMKNSSPVAGFEFRLQLPDGITVATDEDGILMAELSTARTTARKTDYFNSSLQADGTLQVLCGTSTADPNTGKPYTFSGNDGEVALITVNIPEDYAEGMYEVSIHDIAFSDDDNNLTEIEQTVTTEMTVGDNSIVLDENSEEDIEATDGPVKVVVKRTLKKDQWSTICLPFDMTEEQVYAAFGDDVQLQEFDSYDPEYDDDDNVTSILVHFTDADLSDGFYGNYPYVIKVSEDIDEFTVTATIDPLEEECYTEYAVGRGNKRHVYGTFYGTYHAQTTVPENCLFISDNKFWYSTGLTKMKAFRGYFELEDVLSDAANANINFTFDGTTGIREIRSQSLAEGAVYTLQGQFVGKDIDLKKLPRGIYIVNGKKVVIK